MAVVDRRCGREYRREYRLDHPGARLLSGLPAAQQKKLADVPGLQNYARRPVANKMVK